MSRATKGRAFGPAGGTSRKGGATPPSTRRRWLTPPALLCFALAILFATTDLLAASPAQAPQDEGTRATEREAAAPVETALTEAELDFLMAQVADRLRCPVCRNQSILESPSPLAREMQAVIRERLAAGDSPEEVKAYFVSRYGEWVLLQPEPRGMNLLVYLLPALAFLVGGGLVGWRVRAWAKVRREPSTTRGSDSGSSGSDHDAPPPAGRTPAAGAEAEARRRAVGDAPPGRDAPPADFSEEEEAWLREALAREP